jgi:3-dehydroquinate synthase
MEQILIDGASEILIGRGFPGPLLPRSESRTQVAVLTQPAAGRIADRVRRAVEDEGTTVRLRVMPDGDSVKTTDVAGQTYEWLADLNLGRSDTIIGVGGGALTDFSGFVAGTWLRGIESVYVPTTLLGAVDASIGGKTGLNLRGKNLVGLFRHPTRVVIDVDVIEQLPPHLLLQGFAEAIKVGFIADLNLIELFERSGADADVREVIVRAVAVKAKVVEEDFRESGRRAILNFGHTIGHGVEYATGISHGEAVAIGMVAAGALSAHMRGFAGATRQRELLERLGLPTRAPEVDSGEVRRLIGLDKKRDARGLRMVLLEDFGRPVIDYVSADDLEIGLAAIGVA